MTTDDLLFCDERLDPFERMCWRLLGDKRLAPAPAYASTHADPRPTGEGLSMTEFAIMARLFLLE